jgi:splicing factor 3B subunit 3
MLLHPKFNNFVILEAEHRTLCPSEKQIQLNKLEKLTGKSEVEEWDPQQFGYPRGKEGNWASCIRILNPFTGETQFFLELDENEAALCMNFCVFENHRNEDFLVVSTAKGMVLSPKSHQAAFLKVFKIVAGGSKLQLVQTVKFS